MQQKFDPNDDDFLVWMFLQDLNGRCHEEMRKLRESNATMKDLDASMKAHKFSFAAFYKQWLRGPEFKTGALRKYDYPAIKKRYIRWRKHHPDSKRHLDSEHIRTSMKIFELAA